MDKIKINHLVLNKFSRELDGWGHRFKDESLTDLTLNSKNFRCEEFTDKHEGEHLLFSGCSTTFGVGLEEDEVWSKKIYNHIKQDKKVSGYFNLAMPGIGCLEIVANIFKYIDQFGKPDAIFISLPDIQRNYIPINNETKEILDTNINIEDGLTRHGRYTEGFDEKSLDVLKINTFHYLLFLELYCKSNNIKLYMFSWDYNFPDMDLKTFWVFPKADFINYFKEHAEDLIQDRYAITSRDNEHVGTSYHYFWGQSLYDMYTKECKNVN